MSGPFGIHQVPGQPIYRIPPKRGFPTGAVHVGRNYESGAGQYPAMNGTYRALYAADAAVVRVRVWGASRQVAARYGTDEQGGSFAMYTINRLDAIRALLGQPGAVGHIERPGRSMAFLGHIGADAGVSNWVWQTGGYNYEEVWSLDFEPWG